MLASVLPAAMSAIDHWETTDVNGIEAFLVEVEVEVNSGWGDTTIVMLSCSLPKKSFWRRPACCQEFAQRRR